ncbi:tyrosine-type recombinase/integrase [Palleronia sp. THAF1]|uniref:tyrosine-type recombinase/integrase n=1 Tax=Palleronia sp. THAF1 TaxID=2587842 RepID=UPI00156224CE|nr:tyrosine-type recombinase/integrase [Palleronia sp. THAF1]
MSNTAEQMYLGMESGTLTRDDVRTYLDAVVTEELQRIEGERWDESPAISPSEWRARWMRDRAEVFALRIVAQRGEAADLMAEDMDVLRDQGFRPDEMGMVMEKILDLKERFWSESPSPLPLDPDKVLGPRDVSHGWDRHLRSASFEGRARALERLDRGASWADRFVGGGGPEPQPTLPNLPSPKVGKAPAMSRFEPGIVTVADRMTAKLRASRMKERDFDEKSFTNGERQKARVLEQFVAATGKLTVTDLRQEDIAYYVACLSRLPKSYNKSEADRALSFDQLMERGDDLPDEDVGLSGATVNRNLTFIGAMLKAAKSEGIRPAEEIDLTCFRTKDRRLKRAQRPAFTPQEVLAIFAHPTFHGRQSAARPHAPGNEICKDALYWLPLIAAYSGARREDIAGLELCDIKISATIPHLIIRPNVNRGLKNPQSERLLPLHPHLLELGFREYCEETAASGETTAFPDLRPSGDTASFGDALHHRWSKLRKRQIGDARGKVFHSFRHYVSTYLQNEADCPDLVVKDLLGHLAGDITADRYRDPSRLGELLNAVCRLPRVF